MSAFTPDAASAFAGWSELRIAAAERFAGASLPTPDEEIWRYSRIDQLDLDRFTPAACATHVKAPDGVVVDAEPELCADETPDVFAELNRAFMSPVVIRVPPGKAVLVPIIVTHEISGDGTASFPRLVIDAGPDSEVTVVERFVAAPGANDDMALVVPVLQVLARQASRVKYLAVNEVGERTWQIGNQQSVGERDSSTLLATVTLGGDYVRARTEARLSGQGASTKQVALYFAGGEQMHDFRTIQDHDASAHQQRPAVQGRGPGSCGERLHRTDQDPQARRRHGGLPDQPQPDALRGRLGRERPEPRHRDQRRQVQPRVDDRPDRRGAALLPREPGRPTRGRRAPSRARLLRRGDLATSRRRRRRRSAPAGRQQARSLPDGGGGVSAVFPFDEIADGSVRQVDLDGIPVAVVRIGDDVYAISDVCSHANVSLSGGEVWCDELELECPKHGSAFNLRTGEPSTLPATQPVAVYEARVIDGQVVVTPITADAEQGGTS